MTQDKTSRAFRTISEAGEELGLQPHVLRFWESKFSQIKPIKRGGGRRFYRPADIEFIRGIKVLLHDEKHPIKDVQKLIQKKGAGRIMDLGRSIEEAARERKVKETDLLPKRIKVKPPKRAAKVKAKAANAQAATVQAANLQGQSSRPPAAASPRKVEIKDLSPQARPIPQAPAVPEPVAPAAQPIAPSNDAAPLEPAGHEALSDALKRLEGLKSRWSEFGTDED